MEASLFFPFFMPFFYPKYSLFKVSDYQLYKFYRFYILHRVSMP